MSIRETLSFQESRSIPRDFGGTTVTAITQKAYQRAMEFRGIDPSTAPVEDFDPIQQIVQPSDSVRSHLGVGTRRVGIPRLIGPDVTMPYRDGARLLCQDQFGCQWVFDPLQDHYFNLDGSPLSEYDEAAEALSSYRFPDLANSRADIIRHLDESFGWLTDTFGPVQDSPLVIADRNIAGLTEVAFRIRGYENFFIDLVEDPDSAGRILDDILEYKLQYWSLLHEYLLSKNALAMIDVVVECDDLGTQDSLLCSPETMKQVIFPRQERLFSELRRLFPYSKRFFHSDGAIRPIIPDLIAAGVDILNPVQFSAADMELAQLKQDFGKDLVFWGGGIDTQNTLPFGSEQSVRDETKRCIETLAPGGGFVFATVHNIQSEVPPENFWAMWETVQSYD